MANSALPETTAFAEKLSALRVPGPTFRNLDLVRADELQPTEPTRSCAHSAGVQNDPFGRGTNSHIAHPIAEQSGGSARDYLPGVAWLALPLWVQRASDCPYVYASSALGVNFRFCRIRRAHGQPRSRLASPAAPFARSIAGPPCPQRRHPKAGLR
jgi:hypothetical protein